MKDLIERVFKWQQETFPDSTKEGRINHFKEEIREYLSDTTDGEEAADLFMLFIAVFKNEGIDLVEETERKLEINRQRKWHKVDGGYSKHIE